MLLYLPQGLLTSFRLTPTKIFKYSRLVLKIIRRHSHGAVLVLVASIRHTVSAVNQLTVLNTDYYCIQNPQQGITDM